MIASKDNADWLLVGGAFELVPRRLDLTVIKAKENLAAFEVKSKIKHFCNQGPAKVYGARHIDAV